MGCMQERHLLTSRSYGEQSSPIALVRGCASVVYITLGVIRILLLNSRSRQVDQWRISVTRGSDSGSVDGITVTRDEFGIVSVLWTVGIRGTTLRGHSRVRMPCSRLGSVMGFMTGRMGAGRVVERRTISSCGWMMVPVMRPLVMVMVMGSNYLVRAVSVGAGDTNHNTLAATARNCRLYWDMPRRMRLYLTRMRRLYRYIARNTVARGAAGGRFSRLWEMRQVGGAM